MNSKAQTSQLVIGTIIALGILVMVTIPFLIGLGTISNVDIQGLEDIIIEASTSNTILIQNGTNHTLNNLVNSVNNVTALNQTWIELNRANEGYGTNASYINVSGLMGSSDFARNFTISFWVNYTNDFYLPDLTLMLNRGGWDTPVQGFLIGFAGAKYEVQYVNQSGDQGSTGTCDVAGSDSGQTIHRWTNFAARWNGTMFGVYVNGSLCATTAAISGEFNQTLHEFQIGAGNFSSVGSNGLDGSIDEVRIYNISLSNAQISEIFTSGRMANSSLPSTGLILWLSMNEYSGTNVIDKSLKSFNGTLIDYNPTNAVNYFYNNDGRNNTLTSPTDYQLTSNQFRLSNAIYSYSLLTISYNFNSSSSRNAITALTNNFSLGLGNLSNSYITTFIVLGLILIMAGIALILALVSRFRQNSSPNSIL